MIDQTKNNLKIFIADNQELTRAGIISILSEHFNSHLDIEQIENKIYLFNRLLTIKPQILIIDFDLFDFNTISELSDIKKASPNLGVLIVSDNQSSEDILKVLDCGITNYIVKSSSESELIEAVNATLSNRKYFSSEVLDILLARKAASRKVQPIFGSITCAEQEIVKLIAQGLTTKEIAKIKMLSYHTIISHRKNIFRKLAISNSSELILYAIHTGIIDTTEYYI
jgi:DNA-binding NarL/FixJ family response regulator